jgi:hypothetical protein
VWVATVRNRAVMVLLLTSGNIFSLSSRMLKQWEIERYKNFLIRSSPVPTFATGFDWYSQGIILRPGRLNSIVEVKRIQGRFLTARKTRNNGLMLLERHSRTQNHC